MSGRGGTYEGPGGQQLHGDGREVETRREPRIDYTARNAVKYCFTPYRETLYKISEALHAASIAHELHVRPGYATIWAHPDLHERVSEIARKIDQEWIESF